jgi:Kef-type K+ transport system membrane component KefB
MVITHWSSVLIFVVAVVVGQIVSVSLGALLSGHGVRTSIQAGMSLAQIGELSFVIASLGVTSGTVGDFLYPIAVSVCSTRRLPGEAATQPALVLRTSFGTTASEVVYPPVTSRPLRAGNQTAW